jgi:hypothetical protein
MDHLGDGRKAQHGATSILRATAGGPDKPGRDEQEGEIAKTPDDQG